MGRKYSFGTRRRKSPFGWKGDVISFIIILNIALIIWGIHPFFMFDN